MQETSQSLQDQRETLHATFSEIDDSVLETMNQCLQHNEIRNEDIASVVEQDVMEEAEDVTHLTILSFITRRTKF